MNLLAFSLLNCFFLFSSYVLLTAFRVKPILDKLIFSILIFLAQIISTELLLGILGKLYLSPLLLANFVVSAGIILVCPIRAASNGSSLLNEIINDGSIFFRNLKKLLIQENFFLFLWMLAVSIWILWAIHVFPACGPDDFTYHLPPIYQAVKTGELSLLPVSLKSHFAYPFNAELLFLWPAIFLHSTQWVDGGQSFFAPLGVLILFALARFLKIHRQDAFFVSILFFFTPVVLMQTRSNNIDLIANVIYLAFIYFSLKLHQARDLSSLYAVAVTTGLLIGTKYFMLLLILPWHMLILPTLTKKNKRHLFMFILIILLLGGYWYIRNLIILHNPFYPFDPLLRKSGDPMLHNSQANPEGINFIIHAFQKLHLIMIKDIHLGTLFGGYGLAFWGVAFPCWGYIFITALKDMLRRPSASLLLWTQMIIGLGSLLFISIDHLPYTSRYVIFIAGIGLLALGKVLFLLKPLKFLRRFIKGVCLLSVILSTCLLASSRFPNFRTAPLFSEIPNHFSSSEFKFFSSTTYIPKQMSRFWEIIDILTLNYPRPVSVYLSATREHFMTPPLYGSKFQNTLWNFLDEPKPEPDICLFAYPPRSKGRIFVDQRLTLKNISFHPGYTMIFHQPGISLYVKKDLLDIEKNHEWLKNYYFQIIDPQDIYRIRDKLPGATKIITTSARGHVSVYLGMTQSLKIPVYWIPEELKSEFFH